MHKRVRDLKSVLYLTLSIPPYVVPGPSGLYGSLFYGLILSTSRISIRKQLHAVDHSDHQTMRNVASCVTQCELQSTLSARSSNAYCCFEFSFS